MFYVGIEQDISHRKAVERAKNEFVSLASHQLRTPIATISWYAEMLLHGDVGKLTKDQRTYVGEIAYGANHMADLVAALLNVSRIELGTFAVTPEPTDLKMLLEDVLHELSPLIEKANLRTEMRVTSVPKVLVDPKVIRIVFENLLTNAVKYTPTGGLVTISLARQDDDVHFMVEDTGIGIPKEQQERMYQKLFRADNAKRKVTEGTGLGLYLAKAIVEESHGRIWFTSVENQGTTFHVSLPLGPTPTLDKPLAKTRKK